jgi:predicted PurR-regulated permease PerM
MNDAAVDRVNKQSGGLTRDRLLVITLLIATGVILGACAALLSPFLPALTWALSLAVIAYPIHVWIKKHVNHPQLAAGLAVALITVGLVVPVVLLGTQIAQEVAGGVSQLQSILESGAIQKSLQEHPAFASALAWIQSRFDLGDAGARIVSGVRAQTARFLKGSIWSVIQLAVALYSLFFFFRDRDYMLGVLRCLVPLSEHEIDEVFESVRTMVRATIYGNVVTSLLQGTLGGLMFWFLGLPGPLLWGVAMFVFSLVPSLGSFLVWAPAALILAITGSWGKAIILVAWGMLVVGTIDNIVYPFLVGRDIRMHTLAVFLSLLGGLFIFGAAGIVLGPVLFAVALALIDILRRRTAYGHSAETST